MKDELKIGNWYNLKTIFGSQPCRLNGEETNDEYFWEKVYPIPLSESWLKELGFIQGAGFGEVEENELKPKTKIYGNQAVGNLFVVDKEGDYSYGVMSTEAHVAAKELVHYTPVLFVHSLQNACFEKTGKELNKSE
jgi:hypothetical protein